MPVRFAASRKERHVPGRNVCAPWRSACTCWAASSSALPSSATRSITPLLLVVGAPPASAPSTNRARTLRKDISSMETPIAAVRQAYDGRSVRSRCRLFRFLFGCVGLGLHRYFLPWVWLPHQCQAATHSGILYNILQLYYQEEGRGRSAKQNRCLPRVLFLRALPHRVTDEQTSARQRRTPPRRHRACTDPSSLTSLSSWRGA